MQTLSWRGVCSALGFAVVFGALMPSVQAKDSYPYEGQAFSTDARVTSVDTDRDRMIVTDSTNHQYTVDTYNSNIQLKDSNRHAETGDIVPGMRLRITGTLLSSDIIAADKVQVLSMDSDTRPTRPIGGRPNSNNNDGGPVSRPSSTPIELRGTIDSVDNRRGSFVVRVKTHTRTVIVTDKTYFGDITTDNSDTLPVHRGDRVTIAGDLSDNGTVWANTINLTRNASDSANPYAPVLSRDGDRELVGHIVDKTNKYTSRDLKIETSGGRQYTVHVPHNIVIVRDRRAISVHELSKDDVIRVSGNFNNDDFTATRIEVVRTYSDDQ